MTEKIENIKLQENFPEIDFSEIEGEFLKCVEIEDDMSISEETSPNQTNIYSSDEYCYSQCEFYKFCYANHEKCIKQDFEDILKTLTPREAHIIKELYGWDNSQVHTVNDIAKEFDITPERIKQIREKALRKLRHPSRSRKLKDFLEEV